MSGGRAAHPMMFIPPLSFPLPQVHPQDNRRPRSEGVEERESRGKGREVEARDAVAVKKATHTGQDRRKGAPMSSPAQMRGLLHAARYKLWLL